MKKFASLLIFIALLAAACQPAPVPTAALPTLAVLPSLTPSDEPTEVPTQTATPRPTATLAPTQTRRPPPTSTRAPTQTTVPPTQDAAASSTAVIQDAPRFSTLTPAPGNPPTTPQVMADVVITEQQFQDELNIQIEGIESIQRARIDFVPDGIDVELTALGGQAFITGNVIVSIQLTGSFATISLADIIVNAPEPPEAYIQTITEDFFPAMIRTLDTILARRLGEEHNLQNLMMTDTAMELFLLVPQP